MENYILMIEELLVYFGFIVIQDKEEEGICAPRA